MRGASACLPPPASSPARLDRLHRRPAGGLRGGAAAEPGGAGRQRLPHERLRGGAGRQDHVLRHLRAGDGPDLGLHRHPVAGPRPVLRAGRLRDGHVPDAPDRPRRQLQERPARLHGVPRLEVAALALELLATASSPRCSCIVAVPGAGGFRVRLLRLPLAHQGRLLLHHHAGHDLRRDAAVLPQRDRLRRQQRLHRLQAHPGHRRSPRRPCAWPCSCSPASMLLAFFLFAPLAGRQQVRPGAAGDPRRRDRASCSRATRRSATSSPSGPSRP